MDSNRVLVMDTGRVCGLYISVTLHIKTGGFFLQISELDSPANLLANPHSAFYALSKEAGLAGST
jgi:ATP-binding cassette subfamily C (CFTR/MRP) protein 1